MFELVNCHAQFRKDFHLGKRPRKAPFFITADQQYRLWVNGVAVCRGPARGYQASWPFDEVDLAPWLRAGRNWLSIEAYTPGISTFRYLHQGVAGLLCAGHWGSFRLASDATWLMRRSRAHATDTARMSLQLDFQEHVDGARIDLDWIGDPEPGGDWGMIEPFANAQSGDISFSRPPWTAVEPRGIPLLREVERAPAGTVGRAAAICASGWRTARNVAWLWEGEAADLRWEASPAAQVEDGWLSIHVPASGRDGLRAMAIEVGEYVVGSAIVACGAAPGAVLDLIHHERLVDGRPERRPIGEACCIALGNRLRLSDRPVQHAFLHLLGFGAMTLVVRGSTVPVTVRLRLRTAGYPFAMRGEFACSDPLLEAIHAAGRRTQRLCALDAYVDTPWREQAQWWGDARVQARTTFHLDDDARLLARGIRSIAGQAGPQGLTYGHAPTMAHNCILPDFALTWIITLRDLWWQTGDASLTRELWPRVQQVLSYFDTPEARHASGLLRHDTRLWLFEDWSDLWKGEVPTFLNLWYLYALRHLEEVLDAARMTPEAKAIGARAARHERLVLRHLLDRRSGLFVGGLGADAPPSVHDQCLALMLGLAPRHHRTMLDQRLLPWLKGQPTPGPRPSAFWATYVFQILGERGHVADLLACIRERWRPMAESGTTWEDYTWDESRGSTASHAWTAHPCTHLVNYLVGIRQTAVAWSGVDLVPAPVPGIDRASALVPTPRGDVSLAWRRDARGVAVEARLPKTVIGWVTVGGRRRRWAGGGLRRWRIDPA
jgi:alpha-L-rhamnosidase